MSEIWIVATVIGAVVVGVVLAVGLLETVRSIAQGRTDNGKPLAAETARQLARAALVAAGERWTRPAADGGQAWPRR